MGNAVALAFMELQGRQDAAVKPLKLQSGSNCCVPKAVIPSRLLTANSALLSLLPQKGSPPALPSLLHWESLLLDGVYQERVCSAAAAGSLFPVAPET